MASEVAPGWNYWIGLMFIGLCFLVAVAFLALLYGRMFARLSELLKEAQRAALAASDKPAAQSYAHTAKAAEEGAAARPQPTPSRPTRLSS